MVFGSILEQPLVIPVEAEDEGLRLDHFLVNHLPQYSRSILVSAVRAESILVEAVPRKNSYRLKVGERVTVRDVYQEPEEYSLISEKIDFPILYEDDYLLFLVKPPGLVVHPGSGNQEGTLAHGLLHHCKSLSQVGEDRLRPGIVHRLDKDTSGVMVVAKQNSTYFQLVDMFKNQRLEKEYVAIVCGCPSEKTGRVVTSIGRHPVHRQKMFVCQQDNGRHAVTNWEMKEQLGSQYSLLQVQIETGRTHQIRVHLASLGLPVAGDRLYGGSRGRRNPELFPRQMLHARRLSLQHPHTGRQLNIVADLWPDMLQAIETLRKEP